MNSNTHFYLYAKGWYERNNDVMEDLRILVANRSGVDPKRISDGDILRVLTEMAWFEINRGSDPQNLFQEFAEECNTNGYIHACLELLSIAETKSIGIGRPDGNILNIHPSALKGIDNPAYNWRK